MEARDYIIILYDIYGELLNEKQKEYFESYYFQNLSLGEIALNRNVSRNTIHKVIRGVEEKLKFYEEKLALFKKNKIIYDIIEKENNGEIKKKLQSLL